MTDLAYLLLLLSALGFLAGLSVGRAWGYRECDRDRQRSHPLLHQTGPHWTHVHYSPFVPPPRDP